VDEKRKENDFLLNVCNVQTKFSNIFNILSIPISKNNTLTRKKKFLTIYCWLRRDCTKRDVYYTHKILSYPISIFIYCCTHNHIQMKKKIQANTKKKSVVFVMSSVSFFFSYLCIEYLNER
jgi:hypothetical protein